MKLTFLGATHEVTGSCTMIEINGRYGLVDSGMEQGRDVFENDELPVPPEQLEFVVLTHAHIDHSGRIPLLYKNGYRGLVYGTGATCSLCDIMLRDSAHIQEKEAEYKNRKAVRAGREEVEPMYTVEDAVEAIRNLRPCNYDEKISVCEGLVVRFVDAGHLMGSASIEMWLTEENETRKVVFSGDIGNYAQPVIKDPVYIKEADYCITESTYGNRYHEAAPETNIAFLADCIQRTLDRGGTLIIPAFAVGRTQEILYFIRQIKINNIVKGHEDFKVYVDSPLANRATGIFAQVDRQYLDSEVLAIIDAGHNPLMSPGVLISESTEESIAINYDKDPKIIISASGMCDAGRVRHHLKHGLWKRENMVLFAGYQSEGTLGRFILDGASSVKIFGDEIVVNAEIVFMPGKSGHADKAGLLRWVNAFDPKPKMVFVNHGDDQAVKDFEKCIIEEYGHNASAPYSGASFDLITGEYISFPQGRIIKSNTLIF
ncbi:MAG: MBL fold metallo-hydrolase RNA specificity domain-containing protein [Lachnospiraceae bacterium]